MYFGGLDGFAYAVNAQSGTLVWKRDLGSKITTSTAIRGGELYLGTATRHIYRLSTDSGAVLGENRDRGGTVRAVFGRRDLFKLRLGLEEAPLGGGGLQGMDFG